VIILPAEIRARNQTIAHFIIFFSFFIFSSLQALSTISSEPTTIYITATRERRIEIFIIHLEIIFLNQLSSTQRFSFVVTIVVFESEKQEKREPETVAPDEKVQSAKLILKTKKEEKIIVKIKRFFFISIN